MCINAIRCESRDLQPLPCGRCPECKMQMIHGWAFRLMQEEKKSDSSLFITLTYATKNVSLSRRGGVQSLRKRDLQLFFKRLRRAHTKSSESRAIKYLACGEYGGRTKRPHYHIILFNSQIEKIEPAWGLGSIHYGDVTPASCYYTLKYVMKSYGKNYYRKLGIEKEFRVMSKQLGMSYVNNQKIQKWHKADVANRLYLNLTDGKKIAMPRYYKDKLFNEQEREIAAFAGLIRCRVKQDLDTRTHEEKGQAILAAFFRLEFENKLRNSV